MSHNATSALTSICISIFLTKRYLFSIFFHAWMGLSSGGWIDMTSGYVTSKIAAQIPFLGEGQKSKWTLWKTDFIKRRINYYDLNLLRSRKKGIPVSPMKHQSTSGHETFTRRLERDWRPPRQTNVAPLVKDFANKRRLCKPSAQNLKDFSLEAPWVKWSPVSININLHKAGIPDLCVSP